jgi:acyl carrier protein
MRNSEEIIKYLSDYTNTPIDKISSKSNLYDDLGLNSVDFITIIYDLENKYNVSIDDSEFLGVMTVGDIISVFTK